MQLGCGQDVYLKTRTADVIMKHANLINFLSFPLNLLVQYAGIVLLKLSESATPGCISLPLPIAMTSATSWGKISLRPNAYFSYVGERYLFQINPY